MMSDYIEVTGYELYLIRQKWKQLIPDDDLLNSYIYPCCGIVLASCLPRTNEYYLTPVKSLQTLLSSPVGSDVINTYIPVRNKVIAQRMLETHSFQ